MAELTAAKFLLINNEARQDGAADCSQLEGLRIQVQAAISASLAQLGRRSEAEEAAAEARFVLADAHGRGMSLGAAAEGEVLLLEANLGCPEEAGCSEPQLSFICYRDTAGDAERRAAGVLHDHAVRRDSRQL